MTIRDSRSEKKSNNISDKKGVPIVASRGSTKGEKAVGFPTPNPSDAINAEALADMQAYSNLQEKRKKAKRKKLITAGIVSVVILALIVWGSLWFIDSMNPESIEEDIIPTAFVEEGMFLDEVSASGKLKPVSSVSATPEVEGLVGEVFVSEGDTVKTGDKLYTIVNDDLDKAISQAQQGVNEANNGVEIAKIAVNDAYRAKENGIAAADQAKKDAQAAREAAEKRAQEEGPDAASGGSAPIEEPEPFDVAQADSAIRQAELALASANAALADAQESYNDAVAKAEKRTIVSPIDGSVVSVSIEPGKPLGGSSGAAETPVQIADLSKMVISVEINEIDILKVELGQTAELSFSAIPDLMMTGKVDRIASVNSGDSVDMMMDPTGTVTYAVNILIETPDPRLKPGMTGRASIESQRLDDALLVPISAVMMYSEKEGGVMVMTSENPEECRECDIEILASDGITMAVKGDLKAGDELLLVDVPSSDMPVSDIMVG